MDYLKAEDSLRKDGSEKEEVKMSDKVVKLGVVGLERGRHIVEFTIGEPNVVLRAKWKGRNV